MSRSWTPRLIDGGRRAGFAELAFMVAAGLFLGIFYAGLDAKPAAEAAAPAQVRVIDGDTFDYGGIRIRIADIDTPEIRGRCGYERDLALRATSRMRVLLAAGPFALEPAGDRDEDRYGRKLRIVTRGGRSLGDTMVAEGLARPWRGRREPWC